MRGGIDIMAGMTNVADILGQDGLAVSCEIFPPKGELRAEEALQVVKGISRLGPSFISVTCSAGGSGNDSDTSAIAAMTQNGFSIPSVAHVTCVSATPESLRATIADLKARGISNVLALRGDLLAGAEPSHFRYAKDLIPLLKEEGFCVGAAAYPEGHIDCASSEANIEHLKMKQDAGADFFVTQLAFLDECILRFIDDARAAGVTVPIACGIMPFMSKPQIQRMVFMCGASLPSPIIKLLARYEDDPAALRRAGVEYACDQLVELARNGVDGVHVYCMNRVDVAQAAFEALRSEGFR